MKKDITIIIPVYNSEKYLSRCLDSVLNQTINNYKILIINDGSTDNSQKIIDSYCKKNSEIIECVKQKNMGVAKTRNKGITLATTKYIMFLDNDDYIDKDYIETLYNKISSKNADMVISGFRRPDENNNIVTFTSLKNEEWSKFMIMTPWAKIFNREFLVKKNIVFLDNNIGEDIYFNLLAIFESRKSEILDYVGYNWFCNGESVSNTSQRDINKINVYRLLDSCYDELKNRKLLNENYELIEANFISYIYWFIIYATPNCNYGKVKEEYNKLFNWLKERFPEYKKNKIIGFNKPKCETFGNKRRNFLLKCFNNINMGPIFVYSHNKLKKIIKSQ